jgi:hypothetical protein
MGQTNVPGVVSSVESVNRIRSDNVPGFHFDPTVYGSSIAVLLSKPRVPPLGPGTPESGIRNELRRFDPQTGLGRNVGNVQAATACLAGLWLHFDYLEESHRLSQDLPTSDGSFWHAIMHRREPDAWNSKYWWRSVGSHPVLNLLVEHAPSLGYTYTTPQDFVDFCERVRDSGTVEEQVAKRVQLLEWQLLFDHCYRKAVD